jgi:hypothetical protein
MVVVVTVATVVMFIISLRNVCLEKNETGWISVNVRTRQPKRVAKEVDCFWRMQGGKEGKRNTEK